jgi:2-C-methyl-D-erythritol 4-phosphate cytidylyltransferase
MSILTATASIEALVAKVPSDKTQVQLNTDRASMLERNRVFAVLTPKVSQRSRLTRSLLR